MVEAPPLVASWALRNDRVSPSAAAASFDPGAELPPITADRSVVCSSGAATTKPHVARWSVRKLDCSGYDPYPWAKITTGKAWELSPLAEVSRAMGASR